MSTASGPRPLLFIAVVLALGTLGLSVYLTALSLAGGAVAGCGAGSGCSEVLGSKWSTIAFVPVSAVGGVIYAVVLVGLGLRIGVGKPGRLSGGLLMVGAWSMVLAACYYTAVQLVVIKAVCPFCMTTHGIGIVLGVLILLLTLQKEAIKPGVISFVIAALGIVILHVGHGAGLGHGPPDRALNPSADQDGDTWIDDARYVGLFGGELRFVLQDVAYIGDPDAGRVVAVLFDYACPHCKTLHDLLGRAIEDDPSRFVFVPVPLTIDEGENPYLGSDNPRFDDSMERAVLSLAVGAVDREKWERFDRWLFNADGSGTFPRSASDARAKAEQLVGPAVLRDQMTGDNLVGHRAAVERNIALLGLLPENKRYIPVTTTPGAPAHLTERYDEVEVLYELLESAAENHR